jgi:hypothetical protein
MFEQYIGFGLVKALCGTKGFFIAQKTLKAIRLKGFTIS